MNREIVVIESGENRSKFDLLDAALEKAQFAELLDTAWSRSQKPKTEFLVVIKPNLAMFFKAKVTVTDPELVEYLVDQLHTLGYTNVVIGEAQNTFFKWLQNREIPNIARAMEYHFTTPKGRQYQIFDLARDGIPCDFPPEYSISDIPISRVWQEADFRINFAKNKTHEQYFYTLCLKNLLGALPLEDKHCHYHSRLKVWDVCLELYRQFPVHFNIIDAYVSNHGNVGSQVLNPISTGTIIAGANAILVDWVGAIKMGIDPYVSALNRKAINLMGLPENYRIIGSLTVYEGWKNVHPLLSDSFFRLEEAETLIRLFWPASFIVDSLLFPWKKNRYKWINAIISPLWARVDRISLFLWLIISMNYFFVLVFFIIRVWRTLFNQKQLKRKELPINVARNRWNEQDYEGLPAFIRPMEEIIQSIPIKNGSCNTFVDGGIQYYLERDVDFPFEAFISKVDICNAVTYMKDYIGGRTVQVKSDAKGRCIHQLERTVFLPQPNGFVLINGRETDVTKIELIEYGQGFHKIIWKTVLSDNNSAVYDNGTVIFEELNGRTRIKVMVHQKFIYPSLLRMIPLNYFPGLRQRLMARAYRKYFEKTIDNYCSVAKGEYKAIGRPWACRNDYGIK